MAEIVGDTRTKTQTSLNDFDLSRNFIKGINTSNFKLSIDPDSQGGIYIGGYDPILEKVIEPRRNNPSKATHNFNASAKIYVDKSIIKYNGKEIALEDIISKSAIPYSVPLRRRFINAVEADQVISTIFDIYTHFIFNVERKSILRPVAYYRTKNQEELEKMRRDIITDEVQEDLIQFMDNVDNYSGMWTDYAPLAFKHSRMFGTGAVFKEIITEPEINNEFLEIDIPQGTPALLKELNPFYFEKLYQHRKTLKPLFLEYTDQNYQLIDNDLLTDRKVDKDLRSQYEDWKALVIRKNNDPDQTERKNLLLPLNQLVVFKNSIATAPNISFFGVSKIFSILPITELNRETHYNILPTVNKLMSSGSGMVSLDTRNETKMEAISTQLEQGANIIVTNLKDPKFIEIKVNVDMAAIETQRLNNVKHMLMGLNFPSPFINFENLTNKATMDSIAEFFKNTTMEPLRKQINTVMSDQWYLPLIIFFFNHVMAKKKDGDKKEIKKWNFINLKLKVITEFEKIEFASIEDKLEALNNINYLTDQEKREMVKMQPYPVNDDRTDPLEKINDSMGEMKQISNSKNILDQKNKEILEVRKQLGENQQKFNKADQKVKLQKKL